MSNAALRGPETATVDGEAPVNRTPHALDVVAQRSALCHQARTALDESVAAARRDGYTWSDIGSALGVSRQAAFQRFGKVVPR